MKELITKTPKYNKKILLKISIILAILVFLAIYFFLLYKLFKPNVLTWWSDEYEYVSTARNFALFNKLETSFYTAKAVLYGNFPSFGYHSALFSFLMGLFLKIFGANPKTTFIFNYLLLLLTLVLFYFYSKERLDKKYRFYPLILIAACPLIIIFSNIQSPELFFVMLVSAVFFIFFKNKFNFNLWHFCMVIALVFLSSQRITYLVLLIPVLIYTYINWIKNKKIIYFLISIFFTIGFYYLLKYFFGANTQIYFAPEDMHLLQYLRINGISSLSKIEGWNFLYNHLSQNLRNIASVLVTYKSRYFLIHWFIIITLSLNIVFLVRTKIKSLKKELLFILIPEFILFFFSIIFYVTTDLGNYTHIRLILGFIPLNLFYLYLFIHGFGKLKKILMVVIYVGILIFSSAFTLQDFYYRKTESVKILNSPNYNLIKEKLNEIVKDYDDQINISGIDDPEMSLNEYIVYSNKRINFVRLNQFPLSEAEIQEYVDSVNTDIWLLRKNDLQISHYLNNWPFILQINENKNPWYFSIYKDKYPLKEIYGFDENNYNNYWQSLNNCTFEYEGNKLLINAFGQDPYFESTRELKFDGVKDYYIEISLVSPEDSYLQIFFRNSNSSYNESSSTKLITKKGSNYLITKIYGTQIRIDPGVNKGIYVIENIKIYSSNNF